MNNEKNEQKNQEKKSELNFKGWLDQFEGFLDEYMVKKAPFTLPKEIKEFIVKVSPYLISIFVLATFFGIISMLSIFSLSGNFNPFYHMMEGYGYMHRYSSGIIIPVLAIRGISFFIELMAVPGLFKRTKNSWRLLFYASIVSFIGSIVAIYGIVGGIIGAIIGWYILFQVKDLYKN